MGDDLTAEAREHIMTVGVDQLRRYTGCSPSEAMARLSAWCDLFTSDLAVLATMMVEADVKAQKAAVTPLAWLEQQVEAKRNSRVVPYKAQIEKRVLKPRESE